jgi:hypothetical protein
MEAVQRRAKVKDQNASMRWADIRIPQNCAEPGLACISQPSLPATYVLQDSPSVLHVARESKL